MPISSEGIWFTAILTSILTVYIPYYYAGTPAYARISLLVIAAMSLQRSVPQWLAWAPQWQQYVVETWDLGPPSEVRTLAIALCRQEGQEKFWSSVIFMYIALYAPQLTFDMLYLLLLRTLCQEIVHVVYTPFSFRGKDLLQGHRHFYVDLALIVLPLFYAWCRGETHTHSLPHW